MEGGWDSLQPPPPPSPPLFKSCCSGNKTRIDGSVVSGGFGALPLALSR